MSQISEWFRIGGPLYNWQTLIAGGLAVGAALVGGLFINRQIRATERIERDRRDREFGAARAALPLTLNALTVYAQESCEHLRAILLTRVDGAIPPQADPKLPPEFPLRAVEDLRIMIATADAPVRNSLSQLVGHLQVEIARLTSLMRDLRESPNNNRVVTALNIEDYILDAAETYARCAALFPLARGSSDEVPGAPSRDAMEHALRQLGLWSDEFPEVHARLAQRC